MKKHLLLTSLLLIFLLQITSCKNSQEIKENPSPSDSYASSAGSKSPVENPIPTDKDKKPSSSDNSSGSESKPPVKISTHSNIDKQPSVSTKYFFIEDLLMGAYTNGKFLSRDGNHFKYGEFFTQPWFELYSQTEYLRRSTEAKIDIMPGLDNYFSHENSKLECYHKSRVAKRTKI